MAGDVLRDGGAVNRFADLVATLEGPAIRVSGRDVAWTGEALAARIRGFEAALDALGAERIASRLDNGPDWLALDLAIRARGGVHVPLPTFFTPAQLSHALADCGAGALIVAAEAPLPPSLADRPADRFADTLRAVRFPPSSVTLPAGTATITYTSGTTGAPKGVCLKAASLHAVAASLAEAAAPLAPRRHLCLMPLSTLLENVGGVYAALIAGAEIVAPPLAEVGYTGATALDVPTLLACLQRYRPESAILVPQLLLALTAAAEQGALLPDSLKFLAVGGARVGPALLARAAACGLPVYEGYGLSECASVVCLNRPGASRPGSVGRPLPHARVTVRDGELFVEGVRHLGYLGDAAQAPEIVATGDLGHIDEDGYVHVTGRRRHVFITSFGRNVSPEWVESELLQHPAFAQAVVHGEARPFNIAIVWPRSPQADDDTLRAALAQVNAALPDYARVRDFVRAEAPFAFADGLLTGNGRPRRDAILARYRDAVDARYVAADAFSSDGIAA
jgi:long-subunit acyl-CoA synthetase (AMP-forming)